MNTDAYLFNVYLSSNLGEVVDIGSQQCVTE